MRDDEERGFQVRDHRRFTESGEPRDESTESAAAETASAAPADSPTLDERREGGAEAAPEPGLPITFSTFLVSLSTQALACLGDLAGPEGEPSPDLLAAREMIDILGMLREKTRGNLDPAEANLLDGILYDLRMRYVKKVRR